MTFLIRERVGCGWQSEASGSARHAFSESADHHDGHGDDLTQCDSWLCVCGQTDSRGGSWETCDAVGVQMEPNHDWPGNLLCSECRRVYARDGYVLTQT